MFYQPSDYFFLGKDSYFVLSAISGDKDVVNPAQKGTKCAAHYVLNLKPKQEIVLKVRLYFEKEAPSSAFDPKTFDAVFKQRKQEADEFYDHVR